MRNLPRRTRRYAIKLEAKTMNTHQNDDDMRIITSADVLAGLHDDLATKDAEIARILAASRHSADLCTQALDSVRELTAERDALRKDAERYRWLEENTSHEKINISWEGPLSGFGYTLSEAIDAAMTKEQNERT
jgi:hypothetical protein